MLQAVIFDVDGVIVDSEIIYKRSVQETFRKYGVEIGDDEYVRRWMIERTNTPGAISDYSLSVSLEEVNEKKSKILCGLIDKELETMPYAMEKIEWLYGKCPLATVSSDSRKHILRKLGRFSLVERFKVMVTAGDTEREKPYPDPYQLAVELMCDYTTPNLKPGDVLVIEDTPAGVKSAKGVKPEGCKVIAYPNGYTLEMDFPGADRIVYSLAEIDEEMLLSLFPD